MSEHPFDEEPPPDLDTAPPRRGTRSTGPRIPPHNIDAERALLGALLLSTEAVGEVQPLITVGDFYRPAHAHIYAAIVTLHRRGEVADPITIAEVLRSEDLLDAIAGPEHRSGTGYLIDLHADAPGTKNAAHYARIIVAHADLRRIIGVAGQMLEQAYALPDADTIPDIVDDAVGRLAEAVSGGRINKMPPNLFQLSWFLANRHLERPPWVIPGILRKKWRAMIVAPEGVGKLLPLDTPLPTPSGWTSMGDVRVGEALFDQYGVPCKVVRVSPIDLSPVTYRIEFSDGTSQVACADHQWVTIDYQHRQTRRADRWEQQVVTTEQIRNTLRARGGHCANHAVAVAGPLDLPDVELPIDPYLLGVWLGDGSTDSGLLTLADRDSAAILERIEMPVHLVPSTVREDHGARGYRVEGLTTALRENGLLGGKHIPDRYFRASIAQRLALLQGLMDTDGSVIATGGGQGRGHGASTCEMLLTEERLVGDVHTLVRTLGIIPSTISEGQARIGGRYISQKWRFTFQSDLPVATVPFKASRLHPMRTRRAQLRYITAVEPATPVPMRCIQVDSPNSTYLCGEALIPTHNSMLFRGMAMNTAQGIHPFTGEVIPRQRVLMIDCENPDDVILEQCRPIERATRNALRSFDEDGVWLFTAEQGLNLRQRADRTTVEQAIAAVRPDLVCAGPVYKMFRKDGDSDEDAVLDVINVLDDLRTRYGFALALEHHAPKKQQGVRDLDPFGSAVWLRWPELGIKLLPQAQNDGEQRRVEVGRFRRDRGRNLWPADLYQEPLGSMRPWTGGWLPSLGVLDQRTGYYTLVKRVQELDAELDRLTGDDGPAQGGIDFTALPGARSDDDPYQRGGQGLFDDDGPSPGF